MKKIILSAFADEAGPSLSEQIDALVSNNIPYIEIRGVNGKNIADHTPEEALAVAKELEKHGIAIWSIGSPIGKVRLTDDFQHELARFENVLAIAKVTGAKCIRLFSFFDASALGENAKAEVIRRLAAFVEAAKDSGVVLCHENEKGIYGDNIQRCEEILTEVKGLSAVFDPANFIQCGVDTAQAWDTLKSHVYYLHIKDALADGTVVPAGYGDGNLKKIVSEFIGMGGGVATLEPHLHSFMGLDKLSGEDAAKIMGNRRFKDGREAFDFAVAAFRELVASVE